MESRTTVNDFNGVQFEKKLTQLKDSQESINSLSAWCLENKQHHKKIVNAWLNVLKRAKIEHRLTLFYLANDVIQYSKRKNYDFVASWGTTLQKATTMVREDKVKSKIFRIFKIWEQRNIYSDEFITDLIGLLNISPLGHKTNPEPQEFQPSYLINRIKTCSKLETETDLKLKLLNESNIKTYEPDTICASLKDRSHVMEMESEVDNSIKLIEEYVNALKSEMKARTHLISCLMQADAFYHSERKEVKVVLTAYKNFTMRVRHLQKKLTDLIPTLSSPVPSPDINAPSPEPDSDSELTNADQIQNNINLKCTVASGMKVYSVTDSFSAGYYTPATTQNQDHFSNNSYSSFMGRDSVPFELQNFNTSNLFNDQNHSEVYPNSNATLSDPQPVPQPYNSTAQPSDIYNPNIVQDPVNNFNSVQPSYSQPTGQPSYSQTASQPLLPPPMPPFVSSNYLDSTSYTDSNYTPAVDSYSNNSSYEAVNSSTFPVNNDLQSGYASQPDAYNPEEELETWENETSWETIPNLETPESPPSFEKESFGEPIEYDDSKIGFAGLDKDIPDEISGSLKDRRKTIIVKEVDHRNLISLTGSPHNEPPTANSNVKKTLQPPPAPPSLWNSDPDYVQPDQNRVPPDIAKQLILPPPPPPPKVLPLVKRPPGNHDNVESIDMDLSDDENSLLMEDNHVGKRNRTFDNNTVVDPARTISKIANEGDVNNSAANSDALSGKLLSGPENEQTIMDNIMAMNAIPSMSDMPPAWNEDWNKNLGLPLLETGSSQIMPFSMPPRSKFDYNAGYRGRGRGMFAEDGFRGRGTRSRGIRNRPFRGNFNRNNRGFRGQFRGSY